jgi:hypothetical protein
MTVHLMTMLVLGIGIGACLGWMLGILAGRHSAIVEFVKPLPPDFEIVGSVIKPAAPEPTDWEDFEQRTNPMRGEREHMQGVPRIGYGGRY